jgi:hypothetical protein
MGNFQFKFKDDVRSNEFGVSAGLSLPRFFPLPYKYFTGVIPRTDINFSYNYQNRPEYTRNILSTSYGYTGDVKNRFFYQIYPLQMNIVRLFDLDKDFYENLAAEAAEGDAFLLIGDKVFDNEGTFRYSYDLAEAWQGATKLPFCFAVWVARKGTPYSVIDSLQRALTFGIEHTYEAILEYGYGDREYAYEYLTHNIDFLFDEQKHKALQKFWNSGIKVEPRANPG